MVGWVGGVDVKSISGRLAGIEAAQSKVASFYADLNTMVGTLKNRVNEVHAEGADLSGGTVEIDFFMTKPDVPDGRLMRFLTVNPAITQNPGLVGAALPLSGSADGTNARKIYAVRHETLDFAGASTSINSFYNGIISSLGAHTQQAERMTLNQEVLTAQLIQRREEVAGVSIDEEMSNMIQFQRGYQAAAKLLTVFDEILTTTINLGR